MTKWEYKTEIHDVGSTHDEFLKALARNGAIGWEAWFVEIGSGGWRETYYKRVKNAARD